MCGITGAVWTNAEAAITPPLLDRMTDVLAHRGPDGRGVYFGEARVARLPRRQNVALGHRRLAIIDRAGGTQPMPNEDETIWLVYNGEIYNFRELRARLEGAGHHFRSQCDGEVIIHLYEDQGPQFLTHLNGMFALALWDSRRGELLVARDRLGQKPLVYRREANRFLFASELKSLLEVPDVPREICPAALDAYLTYQYVPHPRTIFSGIEKLPPAHYGIWCDGTWRMDTYWRPDFNREVDLPPHEYVEKTRELVASSVKLRLESDVPLGAFLSGGVDSSIIVDQMQQLTPAAVRTFSIGFPVPDFDESAYAQQVAAHLGTQHESFDVEPDAVAILPKLVWHFDEPFADSSAIPTWYVSELTRRHVSVALTGDGGDELFLGYPRYRAVELGGLFDRLPGLLRRPLASPLWQRLPASSRQKSLSRRLKRLQEALTDQPARRYLQWIAIFNEQRRAVLYEDAFLAQLPEEDPLDFLTAALARAARRDAVTATSLADLTTYLPGDLMTKVDIASMAHGLECRQPFLDHRLVELAAAMPRSVKYRRGRGKRVLRSAYAADLPKAVFRRAKMGFGVPLDTWFRNELKVLTHDILLDDTARSRGYFRADVVQDWLDEHTSGQFDHSYRLWSLVIFEMWHRQWIDG